MGVRPPKQAPKSLSEESSTLPLRTNLEPNSAPKEMPKGPQNTLVSSSQTNLEPTALQGNPKGLRTKSASPRRNRNRGSSASKAVPKALPAEPIPHQERIEKIALDQLGLKVCVVPATILVDVVAVHGLGAIPSKTWVERESKTDWIESTGMLPSDLKNARIMKYNYDSLWAGENPIKVDVRIIASKFLSSLNAVREDCRKRPLIFIAHCFGGIVVQRMLLEANLRSENHPVCKATKGIIFLGTPHRGTISFYATGIIYATLAANPKKRLEPGVLDAFRSDDQDLTDISRDFVSLCKRFHIDGFCFYEERESRLGKMLGHPEMTDSQFIVNHASAVLDIFDSHGLNCDHFGLNKFDKRDNDDYQTILRELMEIYKMAAVARVQSMKRDPSELHLACRNKQPRVVECLLNTDPQTELGDDDEKTALHYAAESGSDESVWLLLQKGANRKAQDNRGRMPIDYALREGQAYWLLSIGHETWRTDLNGDTLLLLAVKQRSVATVDWLLARGHNPHAADSNDNSPLINAISSGYLDITRMLLDGGAHLNTKNNLGYPPLVLAARDGHYPIVKLLLDEGVDIEQTGPSSGRRALFEAVYAQHANVVRLLLSRGADVNHRDHDGWTVLALASVRDFDVGIVQQLVEAGADVSDTANPTGAHLPLQEACHWQNYVVVEYLISKGANMSLIIPGGKTILNAGLEEDRPRVVRIFIERGADLHLKDAWGRTPLDVARKMNNLEVEKMIVERLNASLLIPC